jgi:hypothetical protein
MCRSSQINALIREIGVYSICVHLLEIGFLNNQT